MNLTPIAPYIGSGLAARVPSLARRVRLALLVLLVLQLAGGLCSCGFKLRGAVEIPPELNPMYVEAKGPSGVRAAMLQRLDYSQIRRSPTARDARVVVRILSETRRSRVAAVDRDGKVVARELFLTVAFDAIDAAGQSLVPRQSLDLSRTFENPDVEVLGKQLEADLIYDDLEQDAADRILGRLRAVLL